MARLAALIALLVLLAGCGGDSSDDAAQTTATAAETMSGGIDADDLAGVKSYLTDHTAQLTGATEEFAALAEKYDALAKSVDYDYARLIAEHREEVSRILEDAKKTWIEANPYYEQVEGVVAGTPSLAEYDIILDAGSSKGEDPENAVPFDLKLSDGRVLEQPGNLFNLTEGMLWGTRPDLTGQAEADLDGDGKVEFGEALPDALVLASAAEAFERYAAELDTEAQAWGPTASDAFTSLVVMVPTMSEYFGQWKESRFVQGDAAEGDSFNVVSRLSDINDIISGLEIVYDGVEPAIAGGRRGRRRPDRQGTRGAERVHRRPAGAGGGRPPLHARAGGPARLRRAGPRRGRRRPGLPARRQARHRDPAVRHASFGHPRGSARRRHAGRGACERERA